jgi:hypothetical protein
MSSVVIAGDTSGTVTLDAPAVAGSTVLTLPATSGTFLTTTGGVAPGTTGNVLTSNGTAWTSAALPAGGVTSLNGQTGAITNTSLYAIGSYISGRPQNTTDYAPNSTIAGSSLYNVTIGVRWNGSAWADQYVGTNYPASVDLINTGTWRCVTRAFGTTNRGFAGLWVRIS